MRYHTRSDKNQKEINAALRSVGASVLSLGDVGRGCPDILCGYRGLNFLIETKNRARMKTQSKAQQANLMRTPDQTEFHAKWKGHISIAFTVEDALKIIGAWGG